MPTVSLFSIIKKTLVDASEILTSKQKLKHFFSISLYRNAIYLLAFNLSVPATGFIFWLLAARFYAAEDVGVASAIIAATGLIAALSNVGFSSGLVRFLVHSGEKSNQMVNTSFTITGLASIIISVIFLVGLSLWSPTLLFLRQNPIYFAAFIAFTVATTLARMADWPFIAWRQTRFVFVRGIISGILRLPLVVLLAAFFHSFGIFASWGLSLVVAFPISVLFFLPRVQPGYRPLPLISRSVVSKLARFSFSVYISDLLWYLPSFILPIMVLNLLGAELNAYFYIAWSIGNLLFMVPLSICTSLFAEGSYDEKKLASDTQRSFKLSFLILIIAGILIIAIANKLLLIFGASYSQNGTALLRLLTLSAFPLALNYIYLSVKKVQKNLTAVILVSVFISLVTLAVSYWLLPGMGIGGVGIAYLAGQGTATLGIVISFLLKKSASIEKPE